MYMCVYSLREVRVRNLRFAKETNFWLGAFKIHFLQCFYGKSEFPCSIAKITSSSFP